MALHCQQPIQAFRDKMSSSEASLRTKKKTGSIIGRRIHWSMVERKYAESLQDSVASQMISINVLMGARMMSVETEHFLTRAYHTQKIQ